MYTLKWPLLQKFIFFFALCCSFKLDKIRRVLARARRCCVQTFDTFCFQNVLLNGDGDGKNDMGQSINNCLAFM